MGRNMNERYPAAGLVVALTNRARKNKSLVDLAMAFRAHRPEWGSQAVLVALGLNDFLETTNWNLSSIDENLPKWIDRVHDRLDPHVLPVRIRQIRELIDLVDNPRQVELEASLDCPVSPEVLTPLVGYANQGMSFEEVAQLVPARVTPTCYLKAVQETQRRDHPSVLMANVLAYFRALARVASPPGEFAQPIGFQVLTVGQGMHLSVSGTSSELEA